MEHHEVADASSAAAEGLSSVTDGHDGVKEVVKNPQKSLSEMTDDELLELPRSYVFETMIERCAALREVGNRRWKAGDVRGAAEAFEKAVSHGKMDEAQFTYELQEHHQESVRQVLVPAITNLVLAKLRLYEMREQCQEDKTETTTEAGASTKQIVAGDRMIEEALEDLERVFFFQPEPAAKAYYLRALAYTHVGKNEKAMEDLRAAVKKAPKDKGIRDLLEKVTAMMKQEEKESASIWKGKLTTEPAADAARDEERTATKTGHDSEPTKPPPQRSQVAKTQQNSTLRSWLFILAVSIGFLFVGLFISNQIPDPFRPRRQQKL